MKVPWRRNFAIANTRNVARTTLVRLAPKATLPAKSQFDPPNPAFSRDAILQSGKALHATICKTYLWFVLSDTSAALGNERSSDDHHPEPPHRPCPRQEGRGALFCAHFWPRCRSDKRPFRACTSQRHAHAPFRRPRGARVPPRRVRELPLRLPRQRCGVRCYLGPHSRGEAGVRQRTVEPRRR